MNCKQHNAMAAVVQLVIQHGTAEMAAIYGDLVEIAMGVEQEIYLGAGAYERTSARRADRNGTQPKGISINWVQIPKQNEINEVGTIVLGVTHCELPRLIGFWQLIEMPRSGWTRRRVP